MSANGPPFLPDAAVPLLPPLDNTYGALMVGTFVGSILYGLTLHQVYRYTRSLAYKRDSRYVKCMVTVVVLLETWHSAIGMHAVFWYLTTNYFNPEALFHGVWSINLLSMTIGVIIAISQSFFARRLWLIDRKFRVFVVFVSILLLGEAAFATALTVEAFIQPDLQHFQNFAWMVDVALGMVLLADGTLTALLIIVLRRRRTGFQSTEAMLNLLVIYTINTGLLTGTLTSISFFMGVFYPRTLIADGMNMCIAKLYANSLLAALNSRHFVKNHGRSRSTGLSRSEAPSSGLST
ncbi:hypothetical protein C8Q78DRAFT_304050 [Trametes maxima]|nr:hypothetical protein C8Q78DRAFT_304050 [Trametes maxima]